MSYTNGYQTLVQSMNGLLVFNDGAGTVIENGVITTEAINLNDIQATSTQQNVKLWNNLTTNSIAFLMANLTSGAIYLATSMSSGYIFLGNVGTNIQVGMFYFISDGIQKLPGYTASLNLFTTDFTTGTLNFVTGMTSGTINIATAMTSGTLSIATAMTSGTLSIGTSTLSMVLGAFTFLGKSIQSGTSGTFNFFTDVNATSTVNLFSNMPSGTFNIGKGGNINIGQATTGSLIKIDQNGLDTQVIISPQQGTTGKVEIGSSTNTNKIGNLTTVGSTITSSSGTTQMNGQQNLMYNATQPIPAYVEMYSTPSSLSFSNNFVDFHAGGNGSNVDYDVRMNVNTFNTAVAGAGSLRTSCGQQEMLFSGNLPPRNLGENFGLGFGHILGTDPGSYIVGYKSNGTIKFGGCGEDNPIASSLVKQSMSVSPYYGTKLFNGGLSFDKGTLAIGSGDDRGWVPQCGVYPFQTTIIGPGSSVQVILSYGHTYFANPYVTVSVITDGLGGNQPGLLATIYEITTTQVKINVKNTSGGSTGAGFQWGLHYIAWAPY